MTLNTSIILLVTFISLYLTIIEIFTVLFRLTGLTADKARFQVLSMLTNSGFTTAESETIMSSRKRRKLAMATMLFGYTFTVVIVSTLLNVMMSLLSKENDGFISEIIILVVYVIIIILIKRMPFLTSRFDNIVRNVASRVMFMKDSNRFIILDVFGSNVLGELVMESVPEDLAEKTIAQTEIRAKYGVSILAITRNNMSYPRVSPSDILADNDRLVLFGPLESISKLFNCRPSH